jgi:hypothetical protein
VPSSQPAATSPRMPSIVDSQRMCIDQPIR